MGRDGEELPTGVVGATKGPNQGKWHQRILLPARAIGCIIGKGGCKIKEIRAETGAMMIIKGDTQPERLVTAIGDTDCVVRVVEMVATNMITDFQVVDDMGNNRRPPRIMAKGQKPPQENEVQICLLIAEHDCGPIIGKKGARIVTYHQETGCQVYVHNEYMAGSNLPGSNEKVVTITGTPESCGICMRRILDILSEEGHGAKGTRMWDMDQHGPVGFFGDEATWNGSGLPPGMMMNNNQQAGLAPGAGWVGPIPNGVDVFLQRLPQQTMPDGSIELKINVEQVGAIMGQKGSRIKELRRMSGAEIAIRELEGNNCMRMISLTQGQISSEPSLRNAAWLLNVCINAFCDPKASLLPFNQHCSLQDVVMSEMYGKPPTTDEEAANPTPVKQEQTMGNNMMGNNMMGNMMGGNMVGQQQMMGNMMGNQQMMGGNMMGGNMMGGNMMGGNMGGMNMGGGMRGGMRGGRGGGPMRNSARGGARGGW